MVKDAKDRIQEIMYAWITDDPANCEKSSVILNRDRREVIDECIEKAKGKRSYEVKDADDELWDDAVNQVIDTLESLKAEIATPTEERREG